MNMNKINHILSFRIISSEKFQFIPATPSSQLCCTTYVPSLSHRASLNGNDNPAEHCIDKAMAWAAESLSLLHYHNLQWSQQTVQMICDWGNTVLLIYNLLIWPMNTNPTLWLWKVNYQPTNVQMITQSGLHNVYNWATWTTKCQDLLHFEPVSLTFSRS